MLRAAIIEHAMAFETAREGELLDHYAVISAWQPMEGTGAHTYTTAFHTHEVSTHIAAGLFELGANIVLEIDEE